MKCNEISKDYSKEFSKDFSKGISKGISKEFSNEFSNDFRHKPLSIKHRLGNKPHYSNSLGFDIQTQNGLASHFPCYISERKLGKIFILAFAQAKWTSFPPKSLLKSSILCPSRIWRSKFLHAGNIERTHVCVVIMHLC